MTYLKNRAWIEININNLNHNINMLQKILPQSCQIIAVVKANAYGHGDILISKKLNELGIKIFAVATIKEGIHLRKKGIKGDIIILGYTHINDFKFLSRYHLIQTVIDSEYANTLNNYGKLIKVHIKIDTGMHRLGENFDNLSYICKIFQCKNLIVEGFYTHLSSSDSLSKSGISFTQTQIYSFYKTVEQIKQIGYNPKKLHIQSSYGVLNYPELKCNYVRLGILLYGVLSTEDDKTKITADLEPVLSIKARIITTKTIHAGDSAGYGREFLADKNMKIAVISIGYADGIPRNISSNNESYVVIKGQRASILGRICMDQMIVDITHISNVKQNDIVTIIGRDGEERITSEQVAKWCGTITNELLSRLGNRLERTVIE